MNDIKIRKKQQNCSCSIGKTFRRIDSNVSKKKSHFEQKGEEDEEQRDEAEIFKYK